MGIFLSCDILKSSVNAPQEHFFMLKSDFGHMIPFNSIERVGTQCEESYQNQVNEVIFM